MKLTKKYKEIKDKYSKLINENREEYYDLIDKENKEIIQLFNFEGKFLCYDKTCYLYVDEEFEHRNISTNKPIIVLRGQGFNYTISAYRDSTFSNWDQFYSININISDIDIELKKIVEITKEEYDLKFEDMIKEISEKHKNYFKHG